MYNDIITLRAWYKTALGKTVQPLIQARLNALLGDMKNQRILVVGFGLPYFKAWKQAEIFPAMFAHFGAIYWPQNKPNRTTLLAEEALPFFDQAFDKIIVLHGLEFTRHPNAFMQECWRCLKPDGRLLVMTPNRKGSWAQRDISPFGGGQPYSAGQLKEMLHQHAFRVEKIEYGLFMPPFKWRFILNAAPTFEKMGHVIMGMFGGVVFACARKDVLGGHVIRPEENLFKRPVIRPVGALSTRRFEPL